MEEDKEQNNIQQTDDIQQEEERDIYGEQLTFISENSRHLSNQLCDIGYEIGLKNIENLQHYSETTANDSLADWQNQIAPDFIEFLSEQRKDIILSNSISQDVLPSIKQLKLDLVNANDGTDMKPPVTTNVNMDEFLESINVEAVTGFFYGGDNPLKVSGPVAFRTPENKMRLFQIFFAFLAWIIMGTVDNINTSTASTCDFWDPKNSCPFASCDAVYKGQFTFRSFRYFLAIAILVWLWSMFLVFFYYMKLESNGQRLCCSCCINTPWQRMLDDFTKDAVRIIFYIDSILLFLGFVAWIVAAAEIQSDYEFKQGASTNIFFSMGTWFDTYEDCVVTSPVAQIQGAIAMLFFCWMFQIISFSHSLKNWKLDRVAETIYTKSQKFDKSPIPETNQPQIQQTSYVDEASYV